MLLVNYVVEPVNHSTCFTTVITDTAATEFSKLNFAGLISRHDVQFLKLGFISFNMINAFSSAIEYPITLNDNISMNTWLQRKDLQMKLDPV